MQHLKYSIFVTSNVYLITLLIKLNKLLLIKPIISWKQNFWYLIKLEKVCV